MRFDPWLLCFPLACLLLGCGGDPSSDGEGGAASPESPFTGPHFAIEGHGESERLSAVLDVVEGEPPRLAITGFDADENLIAIYATFDGTDGVVGSHVLPIGPVDAEVFAVGTIDGRQYQSQSGELRLNMSSDWLSQGEFDLTLALDETSPLALPPGAPEPSAPAAAEVTLVGTFASEWL
jgi:hypothetical protein